MGLLKDTNCLQLTKKIDGVVINANLKGYCRVVLDPSHMNFFMDNIGLMDEVNRSYMWHILYDHVLMNQAEPREFFLTVQKNIEAET